MNTQERIERLICAKAMLKDVVAEAESLIGMQAALPITAPATKAIDATDAAIAALRREAA